MEAVRFVVIHFLSIVTTGGVYISTFEGFVIRKDLFTLEVLFHSASRACRWNRGL